MDKLIISNYDEDHVSDLPNLLDKVKVKTLEHNKLATPNQLRRIKSATGGIGPGINVLISAMPEYTSPAPHSDFGGLDIQYYRNTYPDFTDTNNLSLVTIFRYYGLGIIFPGDMEEKGWKALLKRQAFRNALQYVNIFVASHHGRRDGYCREVFDHCNPNKVIVSDGNKQYETQETNALYAGHVKYINVLSDNPRRVLTTRNDGMIRISKTAHNSCNIELGG